MVSQLSCLFIYKNNVKIGVSVMKTITEIPANTLVRGVQAKIISEE